MASKLYCFVDETWFTGSHSRFIVSVVTADDDIEEFRKFCEESEKESGKGDQKWTDTPYKRKLAYIRCILANDVFRGRLFFTEHPRNKAADVSYVSTLANTIITSEHQAARNIIVIDGLPQSKIYSISTALRRAGIQTDKIRGHKDQSEPMIRLADALCGLVRGACNLNPDMITLLEQGIETGYITRLPQKLPD